MTPIELYEKNKGKRVIFLSGDGMRIHGIVIGYCTSRYFEHYSNIIIRITNDYNGWKYIGDRDVLIGDHGNNQNGYSYAPLNCLFKFGR